MIKGKTLIELTDVNTGKVERFEDENIITDAAELYISSIASLVGASNANLTNYKRFPIMKAAFGGIKLFENSIVENAANWQLPKVSVNRIVGYASSDTTDGTDPYRGSANLQETTILENGVQLVWDFATTEANGNISCVCLTSAYGGELGQNLNKEPEYKYTGSLGTFIGYDKENDVFITVSGNSGSVNIRKIKLCLNNLKLDELFCVPTLVEEAQSTISFEGGEYYSMRVLDANTLYYVKVVSNQKIIVYYYDLKTGSTKETITIENSNMSCVTSSKAGLIKEGYLYIPNKDLNGIYKINLTNTSDITLFNMPEAILYGIMAELPNGDFFSEKTVFDPLTGDYQTIANHYRYYTIIAEKGGFLVASDASTNIYVMANELMLMSINNLNTPVTKTADKTMKITYTLTYTQ